MSAQKKRKKEKGKEKETSGLVSDFSPTLAKRAMTALSHFQKLLWYGFLMLAISERGFSLS